MLSTKSAAMLRCDFAGSWKMSKLLIVQFPRHWHLKRSESMTRLVVWIRFYKIGSSLAVNVHTGRYKSTLTFYGCRNNGTTLTKVHLSLDAISNREQNATEYRKNFHHVEPSIFSITTEFSFFTNIHALHIWTREFMILFVKFLVKRTSNFSSEKYCYFEAWKRGFRKFRQFLCLNQNNIFAKTQTLE